MEGSFAEELYSESLKLSKLELDPTSITNGKHLICCLISGCDEGDLQDGDGSLWGGSDEEFDKSSDLDREWQKRRDQFHTIGYRDGLIAGKEASSQEGFNIGFKQSFFSGYNWGLVRGVTSAFAALPNELKEMLVETQENRNKFQGLYESVHSLSTTDALKLYHDDLVASKTVVHSDNAEVSSNVAGLQEQSSGCSPLENRFVELQSLLLETPGVQVHLAAVRK
ncbi:hypothetical protein Pint_23834 [Pistacia integerrima]|uniref:Uncharacterized protein n=1 Tax=Pistacia integerrima TaxID=434235 RepID=A0ACC0YJB4_9ROSI|nr:hypothetical protein Pint_23834 [Pistacia integerrima]